MFLARRFWAAGRRRAHEIAVEMKWESRATMMSRDASRGLMNGFTALAKELPPAPSLMTILKTAVSAAASCSSVSRCCVVRRMMAVTMSFAPRPAPWPYSDTTHSPTCTHGRALMLLRSRGGRFGGRPSRSQQRVSLRRRRHPWRPRMLYHDSLSSDIEKPRLCS